MAAKRAERGSARATTPRLRYAPPSLSGEKSLEREGKVASGGVPDTLGVGVAEGVVEGVRLMERGVVVVQALEPAALVRPDGQGRQLEELAWP